MCWIRLIVCIRPYWSSIFIVSFFCKENSSQDEYFSGVRLTSTCYDEVYLVFADVDSSPSQFRSFYHRLLGSPLDLTTCPPRTSLLPFSLLLCEKRPWSHLRFGLSVRPPVSSSQFSSFKDNLDEYSRCMKRLRVRLYECLVSRCCLPFKVNSLILCWSTHNRRS